MKATVALALSLPLWAVGLAAPADAGAEERPRPRKTVAQMPRTASSADGFAEVVAADVPGDPMGFRLPVLGFVTREIRSLEHAYGLQMPRSGAGVTVYALDGKTNDPSVVANDYRGEGRLRTRIFLPSPGFSDLERLRFEVAKAYFRAWVDRARPSRKVVAGEVPDWLVQGLVRAADSNTAHADTLFVLGLWSEGRLPFFPALCSDLRVSRGKAAALPGYMGAFMKERRVVEPALARLAGGAEWDGAWLATKLLGVEGGVEQDRAHDERMARMTRSVLTPGRANAMDVRMFASRLVLRPSEFGRKTSSGRSSWTFREAMAMAAEDPEVREAAARKARETLFSALGRGDALGTAASKFHEFLLGVARGEGADVLADKLASAEEALAKAEVECGVAAPEGKKK